MVKTRAFVKMISSGTRMQVAVEEAVFEEEEVLR